MHVMRKTLILFLLVAVLNGNKKNKENCFQKIKNQPDNKINIVSFTFLIFRIVIVTVSTIIYQVFVLIR